MSTHLSHGLRLAALSTMLWTSMACAWAQAAHIASRIEGLEPIQQHQLQALMASRQEQDGGRLFTDEEVRAVRATVLATTMPLPRKDVEHLSLRLQKVFGLRGNYTDRVVNEDPVFPVCLDCDGKLGKTCHDSSSNMRRVIAGNLLTQHPHLAEAVGGLYLVQAGGPPQLIGTVFVLQGRIVTNVHVMLEATLPAGPVNVRKLKPDRRLEAVFGDGGTRRVTLPAEAVWHRHPNLDLILTAWPAGALAPAGLTLATGVLPTRTPVALIGFPSVNTNTDRREDIDRAFGRCPDARAVEPHMVISMGRIASISGAGIEHDANTMGNSSGSPLIRIADGALVGVHRGDALSSARNSAVSASALQEIMLAAVP